MTLAFSKMIDIVEQVTYLPYHMLCACSSASLQTCLKWRLHPSDPDLASEHASACAARHARLEARLRSVTVECGICLEKVLSKPNPAARRFGLLACDHAFCLNCIREWRAHGAEGGVDVEGAVRTCPVCRVTSHYVTPSAVWPADAEEKEQVCDWATASNRHACMQPASLHTSCPLSRVDVLWPALNL